MLCFGKNNYKLPTSVRRDGLVSISVNTISDTSAGPDLIETKRNDSARHFYIRLAQSPSVLDTVKRVMKSYALSRLSVRVEECKSRVSFLVVQNLAVQCQPQTWFFDHLVQTVLHGL